ncbi:transcription factor bHLH121-like isoform X2 [Magnolia sinica]|uniref:transcription factor bHLH121-like isoform X2 n=1 Tax=Magnolia sinica TaxID=86752 RepID=UPI0026598A80|nr:transcription factor bHLH121-like isoform X2 [Magnolia sinica]
MAPFINSQPLDFLGTDPDRPKNDKATILTDAVEMLKDLTAEVKRLKSEHASLSEESSELIQEKNELRDEKATLKSDIDSLNFQHQQRMSAMFPWAAINPTVPVGASPVSFPAPTPIPDSNPTNTQAHVHAPFMPPFMPFPIHPSLQPLPFFSSPTPDMTDQYFAFPPYAPHVTQSHVERPSAQYPSMQPLPTYLLQLQPLLPNSIPNSESHSTSIRESRNETSEFQQPSNVAQSSISDSRRECSRNGRKASEFRGGMDATESTDCGNKSSDSKCMAATAEVKDSARVMPATSCHSSSLECSSQEAEKVQETLGETRKTTDSASCTRSNPAGVG